MADLHPTPTRLALLAEVDAGRVTWWPGSPDQPPWSSLNAGVIEQTVTARVDELARAGWIFVGARYRWRLTVAGLAVLDKSRREASGV